MAAKKKAQQVRVIAGKWRGRKLSVANVDGLRPTMDRVRETLFNWLMFDVQGASVLDLFAGTGALGIEALSRGAATAVFVERNAQACRQLEENLLALTNDGNDSPATVVRQDANRFLADQSTSISPGQTFDIVFMDPPFDDDVLGEVCRQLDTGGQLRANALIYLEWRSSKDKPQLPQSWSELKSGKAGDSAYALYQVVKHV